MPQLRQAARLPGRKDLPPEGALIQVDGRNKWLTLIQNASLHKDSSV